MKLNGWKRIGIIASVVWILGAGLTSLAELDYLAGTPSSDWSAAAFVTFAPVPLGWGFVYLVLFLVRWVKRGFAVEGSHAMKKTVLWFVAALVFGAGCFFSYSKGQTDGRIERDNEIQKLQITPSAPVVEHHYEFMQHDASIFRFDSVTGEACWIQLSKGDAAGGPSMPEC